MGLSFVAKLLRLGRLYLVFAVGHVALKILRLIWWRKKLNRVLLDHIPGAPCDFAAKSLLENVNRLHDWRRDYIAKYQEENDNPCLIKTTALETEVICATDDAVETMLKGEFRSITKPGSKDDYMFHMLGEFLGAEGIFVLQHGETPNVARDDKLWYSQRKTASKIFTKSNFMNLMSETFSEKIEVMLGVLRETAARKEKIDFQEKMFCFTFDSIQKIFFNRTVDTVSGKQDEYARAFDDAHRYMLKHVFSTVLLHILTEKLFPYPFGSIYTNARSIPGNPLFYIYRELEPNYVEFKRNVGILDRYTYEMIRETRRDPQMSKRRDLLANFVNSGSDFTDRQLRDVILNFIIAGRDTSACTLTWMFYYLTQNPDVQEKLCREIDEKLKDKKPTLEDLTPENMPYLNGVVMETLRLSPPVPEDMKITLKDVTFPDGSVVPPGVKLLYVPYTMGRDAKKYPDPLKFNPDRWIPFLEPSMYSFPVFQAGNRFCLGKDMAKLEVKMLASSILQEFTFTLEDDPANINYALMVTMSLCNARDQSSHNLWLKPQLRQ